MPRNCANKGAFCLSPPLCFYRLQSLADEGKLSQEGLPITLPIVSLCYSPILPIANRQPVHQSTDLQMPDFVHREKNPIFIKRLLPQAGAHHMSVYFQRDCAQLHLKLQDELIAGRHFEVRQKTQSSCPDILNQYLRTTNFHGSSFYQDNSHVRTEGILQLQSEMFASIALWSTCHCPHLPLHCTSAKQSSEALLRVRHQLASAAYSQASPSTGSAYAAKEKQASL